MRSTCRVRVYIACSLDGFIAGKGDDLSWLPGADPGQAEAPPRDEAVAENEPGSVAYDEFMGGVGVLLMGRRTYDVVLGFGGEWPYGERPVLVATTRPLESPVPTVRGVSGSIEELVAEARRVAGDENVYLDGGNLIRQALDRELIDDLIVTMVPVVLGEGHPLFAGANQRRRFEFTGHYRFGGTMLQIHARPLEN